VASKTFVEKNTVMQGERSQGAFIVIEGPDASGKQTQTANMVDWLRNSDFPSIGSEAEDTIIEKMPGRYPDPENEPKVDDSIRNGVWQLSFPSYGQTPGGRVVKAYLNGELGDRDELSMETIVDIYAADRKQFKELISEYVEEGGIIICDRYREANLIHQLVGFEAQWEEKLQYIKSIDADLPDADTVFYLDISPEEAISRMDGKEKDIHELDDSYMKRSNLNGRKVAEYENWTIIDGERSMNQVKNDLKAEIKSLLEQ
jgi:dTMP kinase